MKDQRVFTWEGNKTFRGAWRRKNRRLTKKERRAADRVLKEGDSSSIDSIDSPKRQVPRRLKKTAIATLECALDIRAGDRTRRFSLFLYASRYRKRVP